MLRKNNHRSSSSSMVMAKEQPSSPRQSSVSSFMAVASPRFFNGFLARTLSEPECSATMSPTSILDAKPFDPNSDSLQNRNSFEKIDGVGLAILDSLIREKNGTHLVNKSNSKMVLFGAKLKVQIPAAGGGGVSPGCGGTPKSPGDFGIKTRNAHLFVPPSGFESPLKGSKVSPRELDLSEMELSEDYTCVITHGPNPKTTHIFDDCVVEDCCGVVKLSELGGKDCRFPVAEDGGGGGGKDHAATSFLKVCDSCSECLGHGKDVFMYRGKMAFCSHECRNQEMIAEGGKNLED